MRKSMKSRMSILHKKKVKTQWFKVSEVKLSFS